MTDRLPSRGPFLKDIRQGFVYERVPHITLGSIAYNAEIDVIYEKWQRELEPLREALNQALGKAWEEWEIPREAGAGWPAQARDLHASWWEARRARQAEIDASIARNADTELPLRPALRAEGHRPRDRAVHGREPVAASRAAGRRGRRAWEEMLREEAAEEGCGCRRGASAEPTGRRPRRRGRFRPGRARESEDRGRAKHEKGRAARVREPEALARAVRACRGTLRGQGKERRAAIFIGPEYGTVTKADVSRPRARRRICSTC